MTISLSFDQKEIGNRLVKAREALGYPKRADFLRFVGWNQQYSYIADVESGRKLPSEKYLLEIQTISGISRSWVMTGEGEMFVGQGDKPPQVRPEPPGVPVSRTVQVPLLNMAAQLGTLSTHNYRIMRGELDLIEIVPPRGVSADQLLAVDVDGYSMYPAIKPGTRIIVSPIPLSQAFNGTAYLVRYVEADGAASMVNAVKYLELRVDKREILLHSEDADNFPPVRLDGWQLKEIYHIHQRIESGPLRRGIKN